MRNELEEMIKWKKKVRFFDECPHEDIDLKFCEEECPDKLRCPWRRWERKENAWIALGKMLTLGAS